MEIPYTDVTSAMIAYTSLPEPLRTIPIKKGTKIPCIKAWQNQGIPDRQTILDWSSRFPDMNVGLILGHEVVGIDVDGESGEQMLQEWSNGEVPKTWEFLTPGGGRRLLFSNASGMSLSPKKSLTHQRNMRSVP